MATQQILTDLISRIAIRREEHRVLQAQLNELESMKSTILLGEDLQNIEFAITFKYPKQAAYLNITDKKNMLGVVNRTLSEEISIIQNKMIELHITIRKDLEEYGEKLNHEN